MGSSPAAPTKFVHTKEGRGGENGRKRDKTEGAGREPTATGRETGGPAAGWGQENGPGTADDGRENALGAGDSD